MKAPLWLRAVSLLSLGLPAGLGGQARGGGGPVPVTLASMRDAYRPLLVFAPTDRDPRLVTQLGFLAEKGDELHERQVILVPLLLRSSGRPWRVASNADIGLMEASELTWRANGSTSIRTRLPWFCSARMAVRS